MREVGVDGLLPGPDLGYPSEGSSSIRSECQRRLFHIELNLESSDTTFDSLRWAITELERLEQQRQFGGRSHEADDDRAGRGSGKVFDGAKEGEWAGSQTQDSLTGVQRSFAPAVGKGGATSTVSKPGRENVEDQSMQGNKNDLKSSIDEFKSGGFKNWKNLLDVASGSKRKPDDEESGYDGEKRARIKGFCLRALKEAVTSAIGGDAGMQMSDCINSRLESPECVLLTNLVSHCLLVSLDQVPADGVRESLALAHPSASAEVRGTTRISLAQNRTSDSGEWMWLHRWFVRTVLSGPFSDTSRATLDWLVAYLTASRSTITELILQDLVTNLKQCEIEGQLNLATYIRRVGILEYAAFREPDRTSGNLLSIFSSVVASDRARDSRGDGSWQGCHPNIWIGLMMLCPRLFSAFSRLWVPTLSVEVVKTWSFESRLDSDCAFLPAVWNILGIPASEEPDTRRAWFCAAMMKRLSELAPVASHVVLLLSALCDEVTDGGAIQWLSEVGYYLLWSLHEALSKEVLSTVLGVDRDKYGETSGEFSKPAKDLGVTAFLENLLQHAHLIWRKALDACSLSHCPCCDVITIESKLRRVDDKTGRTGDNTYLEGLEETRAGGTSHVRCHGLDFQRGCLNGDPLIQLCQLLFLCCTEHAVADLLASAIWIKPCPLGTLEPDSLKTLLLVKKMMQTVVGQGRGSLILELWAQRMTEHLHLASDEQALHKVQAIKQLLDINFWQKQYLPGEHTVQRTTTSHLTTVGEEVKHGGISRKVVWILLRAELNSKWLHILPLLHREGAWDLRLAVLGLLQQLPPDSSSRSQAVANRLKGVMGLYFSWLETFDDTGDLHIIQQGGTHQGDGSEKAISDPTLKWQYARAMEHLKRIIINLASCSYPSFTLMVNSLLDFSFEHCPQMSTMPSTCSSKSNPLRKERSTTPLRRMASATRTSFSVAPLSTGRLDRYGKLTLVSEWASEVESYTGARELNSLQLSEENCRIQSGGLSSLHNNERERFGKGYHNKDLHGLSSPASVSSADSVRKGSQRNDIVSLELGNLLRRTLRRAIMQSGEVSCPWPYHPLSVLASLMIERLETPHEVIMTMEQYEEVLPKHISSLRHIFLAECFSQNAFLMEMLELVIKYGGNGEMLRSVEFVRVLLADSISRWHSTFRTRRSHSAPPPKVDEEEARSRLQVHRLIQLVASAGWLPYALASSGEIVAVIDGADIADLLLLIWRCMHHALAFGSKACGGSCSNLPGARGSTDGQGLSSSGAVGDADAGKEGTYTEWESHYFSILRQNVAQIGPHFAQVYPLRKSI